VEGLAPHLSTLVIHGGARGGRLAAEPCLFAAADVPRLVTLDPPKPASDPAILCRRDRRPGLAL
jgi:hypothetical protein